MPVRHALLAALAVLVTGMAVYLFLEVRKPASAQTATVASKETKDKDPDDASHDDDEPPARPGKRIAGPVPVVKNDPKPETETPAPAIDTADAGKLEGPKLDAVMAEANKAYDKQDFDEARSIAQKVLKQHPTNTRMLRIMTSSHCIEADTAEAQKYFNLLPGPDREQMKTRCARYGVTFVDPPAK